MAFLIVKAEPAQGLTCKLLLDTATQNVLTTYSPEEGVRMFRRDMVDMDMSSGEKVCNELVKG